MYSRKISAGYDCMIHDNKQIGYGYITKKSNFYHTDWQKVRLKMEVLK